MNALARFALLWIASIPCVSAAIAEPIIWKGTLLRIGASVGLARYPEDGLDAHSLLQRADESMYLEKARRQSRAGRYGQSGR